MVSPRPARTSPIDGVFAPTWDTVSAILFQLFYGEVVRWETLSHPNVLKLVGVQDDIENGQFVIVSEWMVHGNVMKYIEKNLANRLELVRDFTFPATSSTKMRQ